MHIFFIFDPSFSLIRCRVQYAFGLGTNSIAQLIILKKCIHIYICVCARACAVVRACGRAGVRACCHY